MKTKLLLALLAVIGLSLFFPQDSFSQKKKYYILFDNFEDQKTADGTTITNLFDTYYWEPLSNDVLLGEYAERKPFSLATFMEKDIMEYDAAVFVMGTQHHLATTIDGIKVLDKVKQMLAANKTVLIIGSNVIPAAFGSGGDPDSKAFLESWLGMKEPKIQPLSDGSTIWGMRIDGVEGDPVSKGYKKQCNRQYSEHGEPLQAPFRYYAAAVFFSVTGGKNAIPFDYMKEVANVDITETRVTGVRAEEGQARLALWSINFDIVSGWHASTISKNMTDAIRWGIRDYPHPEGYLTVDKETVDFGAIDLGQSGYQSLELVNTGKEKFNIKNIYVENSDAAKSFTIVEGADPRVMNPGDKQIVNLKFTPKSSDNFEDFLAIETDSYVGDIAVRLIGQGGSEVYNGPRLALDTLTKDFGSVPYGSYSEVNIKITNIGNAALVVNEFYFENDGNKTFTFPTTVKLPMTIPKGASDYVKVRFTSSEKVAKDFTGKIIIATNMQHDYGFGLGKGFYTLKARSAGEITGTGLTLSSTSISFDKVDIGDNIDYTLSINNTGSNKVKIISIGFDKNSGGENLAQFEFLEESNVKNKELLTGEKHDILVRFHPEQAKQYAVSIQVLSTDPYNDGVLIIPVTGVGVDSAVSVRNDQRASVDGFSMELNPNPVNEFSNINYTTENDGKLVLDVYDMSGRKVFNVFSGYTANGTFSKSLNSNNLNNGIYFITAEFNGKTISIPFAVSR